MKTRSILIVLTLLAAFLGATTGCAATYTWIGSSGASWAVAANWSPTRTTPATSDILQFNAGGTQSVIAVPTEIDGQLIISGNTAVTLTGATGAPILSVGSGIAGTDLDIQAGSSLTLANGGTSFTLNYAGTSTTGSIAGTLAVNSGVTWNVTSGTTPTTTVSGTVVNAGTITGTAATLTFASGSTYQHNYTTSAGTIPTATWNSASTCAIVGYIGNTTAPGGLGQTFGNFTWNCPSQTGVINLAGALTTVAGSFTLTSTGSGGSLALTATTASTINISGNLVVTAGTLNFSTGTAAPTINVTGNVQLNGGTLRPAASTGVPVFNLSGNWSNNGGTFTPGTGTVLFAGAGKTIGGSSSTTFAGLSIASGASVTLNNNTTCSSLTFAAAATASSLTHSGTSQLTVNGAVTINQPTASVTTAWNINAGTATVSGLINLAGTSSTTTRIGTVVITTGTLNANGGMTFVASAAATKVINMSGGAGTLNLKGALTVPAASSTLTAGSSSVFNYADTANQTVNFFSAGAYNSLNINNTGPVGATLSGAITSANVSGNLSVQSGTLANSGFAITLASAKNFSVSSGATFSLGGTSTMVTVSGGGTKTFGATSLVNYAGTAQAVTAETYGNLTLSGSGTKTLPGSTINVAANFAMSGTPSATTAGNLNITGTASIGSGTTLTAGNPLTVGGATTVGGTLTLSAANTFSGGLTLSSGGLLNLNSAGALGGAALTINGGTINNTSAGDITLSPSSPQIWNGSFVYTGGTRSLNLGTAAVALGGSPTVTVNGNTLTVGGPISGGFNLTKAGAAGTLALTGNNTFSGVLAVSAGTLSIPTINNASTSGPLGNSASAVVLSGTLNYTGADATPSSTRPFTMTGTGVIQIGNSGTALTLSGAIGGTGALTKTGSGTLALSGANTFTGVLTVSAGTLSIPTINNASANGPLGNSATAVVLSGTLEYSGTDVTPSSTRPFTMTGTGTFQIDNSGTALTLSGAIGGTGILTKTGSGTLTMRGNNTYSSGTTITGGTVSVTNVNATGNQNLGSGGIAFASGGTLLNTGAGAQSTAKAITLNSGGGVIAMSGNTITLTGTIGGGGGLTCGGSDLILNRASGNNAIGPISVNSGRLFVFNTNSIGGSSILVQSGGTLDFSTGGSTTPLNQITLASGSCLANRSGTLAVSTANVSFPTSGTMIFNQDDVASLPITVSGAYPALTGPLTIQVGGSNPSVGAVTLSGAISGSGGLTKTSTGTLILGSANSYTGGTAVSAGSLTANATGSLSSGTLSVASGATVTLANGTTDTVAALYLGGTPQVSGTWGSTASSASNKNSTYFGTTATGVLNVSAGIGPQLIVTLPGQTFTSGSGNSGTVASQAAGTPFNITLTVVDSANNIDTNYSGSKTVSYTGPANAPDSTPPTYTTTVSFTAGQATGVATTLVKAETVAITASISGLTGVLSSSLTVVPATVTKLAFATQPSNRGHSQAITPAVTVQVQDQFGNLVTSSSASVTVAIGNNPAGGALSGTTTVNASSGVASFSTLSINNIGTGYTLAASSSGLMGETSGSFNITTASWFSIASGNWDSTSTWSATSGGAAASGFPIAGDTVTIERGFTVTVDVASACASLQLGSTATTSSSGTLTFSGSSTLTVSGAVLVGSNGNVGRTGAITFTSGSTLTAATLTLGGPAGTPAPGTITMTAGATLSVGGAITVGAGSGTWTPGTGTVILTANNTLPATIFTTFNNLTINGGTTTMGVGLTIGSLSIGDGATFTAGAFALTVTGTTTVGGGTSGTLSISSATGTKTFTGAVTINSGGALTETAGATLSFGSDVTINGTLTEFAAATVGIAGSLANNGTYSASTGVHTFSGATKTLSGTSTIAIPSVTLSGTYTLSGTLTVSTTLAGAGTLTMGGTRVLNIGAASVTPTLAATAIGNTVNYTGAAQTVKATTYYNLIFSGSGSKSMAAGTAIDGNLSIAPAGGGAQASIATGQNLIVNSLTLGGALQVSGTWGSTTSAATHQNNTYFAATTGILTVGGASSNPIALENALTGNPPSEWEVSGTGDTSIQGFATEISVNKGETVHFKIDTAATAYEIKIYRLGYYNGTGARLVATVLPSATLPQTQPAPIYQSATGLTDCGNWAESASWQVPANATSGIYIARPVRADTQGASHIFFVVRDDASTGLLFQTSDTTWQAYNNYGGNSLYDGVGPGEGISAGGRAFKVSYNRPLPVRGIRPYASFFSAEYSMVRWLEANGYDVSYTTGVDTDRRGNLLLQHRAFLSVGHDEYWSAVQRTNVVTARNAGVHLAFFSGNAVFWKTRWETSIDGSGAPYRTLVCYKETHQGAKIDPSPEWTGTWRDPRFSPPSDGGRPEYELMGTIFMVNGISDNRLQVPAAYGAHRFWRNTTVGTGGATFGNGTLGFEWDESPDNGFRPPGLMKLSLTITNGVPVLQDYGSVYANGQATHSLTLYRHGSGGLVFGAGTVQWSWGLDDAHDEGTAVTDVRMQQATVNLFADMGAQPGTLQPGLVPASESTDSTPPTSVISTPIAGAVLPPGSLVTIAGTAADSGGGLVWGVEVSTDGGTTWHPAVGQTTWSYAWTPVVSGSVTIKSRAVDDSGNLETPSAGVTVTVPTQITIWPASTIPTPSDTGDTSATEVGVKFRSDINGNVTGIRFYKGGVNNSGPHVGSLWSSTGTLLASATFTGESDSGWQQVNFTTPVAISANTTYIASYYAPNGHYAGTEYGLTAAVNNAPLHALADGFDGPNGVYKAGSGFPNQSYHAANYWVDVTLASDTTAPQISSRSPAAAATDVSIGTTVTVTFNEAMDPASITTGTISLSPTVPATVTYDAGTKTATLTPTSVLNTSTLYTVTVVGGGSGVKDASGNPLAANDVWSFTTQAAETTPPTVTLVNPANGATGVSLGTTVTVTFSEAMNAATITTSTITLNAPASLPVAATVTYNSSSHVAVLTPASPLALSTPYTVTVVSGSAGVKDLMGNALAANFTSSFTTTAQVIYSIWPANPTPPTPDAGDASATEVGVKFRSDINGNVTGIRFYKGGVNNSGPHVGSLWSSTGTLLASATFTGESDSGWQQVNFTTPVAISANTTYIASYYAPNGHYAGTEYGLTAAVNNAPLHALADGFDGPNGVYKAGSGFPNQSYHAANYWVDVTLASDTTAPQISSRSPAAAATDVSIGTTVTVTFNEAMDPASITTGTISLSPTVPATVTYDAGTKTATLTPTSVLNTSTLYTVTVVGGGSGVKDASGNPLAANDVWSFTTQAAETTPPTVTLVNPANGATGVSLGTTVTVTFSEAMNAATITTSTITLNAPASLPVAATVTYNSSSHVAVLTPASPLALSTPYTVTVVSGSAGVKDLMGNALAANFTSSFTTTAQVIYSIWPANPTPPTPDAGDASATEVGVKFRSDINGNVTGIRFYKGGVNNSGPHVGSLWSSTGTLLASATFTGESDSGWQQVNFTTPVAISANTTYIASYHAPNGHYAGDAFGLTAAADNPPLHALANGVDGPNGVYGYGPSGTWPTNTYNSANYWVDVAFERPVLTITANGRSKTYGETVVFNQTTPSTDFTVSGLLAGDSVTSVTLTSAGTAASATVGSYPITVSAAQGVGLDKYTIAYVTGNLTVNPATLTITALPRSKTYGAAVVFDETTPSTDFSVAGLLNSDSVDSVTLTSGGAAATATVAGNPHVITPSGAVGTGLGNYTIGYVTGNLTVNPATLTITALPRSKTYGAAVVFDETTPSTDFSVAGLLNSDSVDSVTLTSGGAAATATVAGNPHVITPSGAVGTGLGNYTIGYVTGNLTVNPATLTITALPRSKTYGAAVVFDETTPSTDFSVAGLLNSDSVDSVTLTSGGAAATATVAGNPHVITPSGAVGTGLGNYTIGYVTGNLTVNPATLTITALPRSKTYGAAVVFDETTPSTDFSVAGLLNSDSVDSVTLTSGGAAATATVAGNPHVITPSGAVGTGLGNYTIGYVTGNLTVNPATLTITALPRSKTYGAAVVFDETTPSTDFSVAGLLNSDSVDSVTLTSGGAAATATVAGNPHVITPSGAVGTGLGNYTIGYVTGNLTVNPATLTITALPRSKTYGAAVVFDETTPSTDFSVAGLLNSDSVDSVTLTSGGAAATATVAGNPHVITPSGAVGTGLGNYTIGYVTGNLTVNPATLTITALPRSKTYGAAVVFDETTPSTDFSVAGLLNSDSVDSVTLTSGGAAATATVAGNPHVITPSGAVGTGLGNYTIGYVTGNLTVNPATLTITALPRSKTYGAAVVFDETTPSTDFSVAGLLNSDSVDSVTLTSGGAAATATVAGNPHVITPSGAVGTGLGNYTIGYVTGNLTVNPATLTITALPRSKTYGAAVVFDETTPSTDFSVAGLLNSDSVDSVTLTSGGAAATATVAGNPHVITPSGAVGTGLGNYTIGYVTGNLTVNPATLTITALPRSKTYGAAVVFDETTPSTDFSVAGLLNSDSVDSVTLTSGGAAATATVAGNPHVITPSGAVGTGLGNYTIGYVTGNLTVNPATLTITALPRSKTYGAAVVFDETTPSTDFSVAGLLNSDSVDSVTLTSGGAAATATVAGNPHVITPSGAVGTGLGNYTIGYVTGNLTVNPATLTITALPRSKTYGAAVVFDETTPSTDFSVAGLLNSDSVDSVTLTSGGAAATATVAGNPHVITPSGAVGTGLGNYTIGYVTGNLTVNPATLTITALPRSKTYGAAVVFDETTPSTDFSVAGLLNSDSVDSVTLTSGGAAATATVAGNPHVITPSGAVGTGLGNYTIGYVTGNLTVNPATLTITALPRSKTYGAAVVFDETTPSTDFSVAGLLNSDSVDSVTLTSGGAAATATVAGNPHVITPSGAVGTGLGNYTIGYVTGNLTVNPATLTITALPRSKTYGAAVVFDETTPSTDFSVAGLLNSDSVDSVTLTSGGAAATATVAGNPHVITPSGAVGTGLGNYTIGYVTGNLTVNPATLTITALPRSKTYGAAVVFDETTPSTDFSVAGLLNSDSVDSVTLTSGGAAATATVAGNPHVITPSGAVGTGLGNYTIGYVTGNLTVNPATLTITALPRSKTYGAAVVFDETTPSTDFSVAGLLNSDSVDSVTLTSGGAAATATVAGNPHVITPSGAVGTGLGNYTIGYVTGNLTVNPATLTITALPRSKTYGAAVVFDETTPSTDFSVAGLLNSDSVDSVTLTSGGAAATATVAGNPHVITPSGAVGTGLGNYTIGYVTGNLTVNPATLTITALPRSKTYGAAVVFDETTPSTDFSVAGLLNSDSVDSVTLTSGGAAATATVAGNPHVITPSGAVGTGLGNYTIGYVTGNLTVNPATLTITALPRSKTYGAAVVFDETTPSTDFSVAGLLNSDSVDSVTLTSGGAAATATVAGNPHVITPSGAVGTGLGNYTIGYVTGNLTVNPATLGVTARDTNKVYGSLQSFAGTEFSLSGSLFNGNTLTNVNLSSTGTPASAGVGSYEIMPSAAQGSGLSNYTIFYTNGTLTVGAATLGVTARDTNKVYGSTQSFAGTEFSLSGTLFNGNTLTNVNLSSGGTAAGATVGSYAIVPSAAQGVGLSNYTIFYTNGTLTVGAATLGVTARDTNKVYGSTQSFAGTEFSLSGSLYNGNTLTNVNLSSTGTPASATVGSYAIVPSAAQGVGLSNYAIFYTNGTLTVGSATLGVTARDTNKVYGSTQSFARTEFSLSGSLYNGNTLTNVNLSSTGTPASATVGSYAIVPSAAQGVGLSNYTIFYTNGTLTVGAATLGVTARDTNKVYGSTQAFAGTEFSLSGTLFNGNTLTNVNLSSTGAPANATVGSYTIVPSAAQGNGLTNYAIFYTNGTLTVGAATLGVTARDTNKVYGSTQVFAGTEFSLSGTLFNGNTLTNVNLSSTGTAAGATVGNYAIVPSASQGVGLSNYTIFYTNGTLTVGSATLGVTARDTNKVYGSTQSFAGTEFSLSGSLYNGNTLTNVNLSSTGTPASATVGSYAIVPSAAQGVGLSNYTIFYTNGTLTVGAATLGVTARDTNKVYGSTQAFAGTEFSLSGTLFNGNTLTNVNLSSTGAPANATVGSYTIVPSAAQGNGLTNYAIFYTNGTLTVGAATLGVTARDTNKVYGSTQVFAGTEFSLSGTLFNGNTLTNVNLSSTGTAAGATVGNYAIVPSASQGVGLSNYTIFYTNGTLTVGSATLGVTARDTNKVYGSTQSFAGTEFSLSGSLYNGNTLTNVNLSSTGTPASATVGSYAIVPSAAQGVGLSNYTIFYTNGTLTVTGAVLSVTASNATRPYGLSNPVFSGVITGIQNGDNIIATYATTATISSPVGTYPIVPSLVDPDNKLPNYVVGTNNGTLTITVPAAPTILSMVRSPDNTNVTITWTSVSNYVYRVQYKAGLASTSWLNLAPDVTATGITASFTDHPGTSSQRFYRVVLLLTETPLIPLVVVADDVSRVYGSTNPVLGGTIAGVQSGDNITATYATAATAGSSVGTYPIIPSLVDPNGQLYKYIVTMTNGTLTVGAATLGVTARDTNKVYGTTQGFAGTEFSLSGTLFNGNTLTNVNLSSAGAPASATVGSYAIVPSAAQGSGLSNYAIFYTNGSLTVGAATLGVTAWDTNKAYGTTQGFAGTEFSLSGTLFNGNTLTNVNLNSTGAPASATVGSYAIVPSAAQGSGLSNYTIFYINGSLTVGAASLGVTARDTNKVYGSTQVFAGTEFTRNGTLYNGDTLTNVSLSSAGSAAGATVGNYPIVASGAQGSGLNNYTIFYTNGTLTVTGAVLTVTATNATRPYGVSNPVFSGVITGIQNGDNIIATYATTATISSPVGTYPIVPSLADPDNKLPNYVVTTNNGTLTITVPAAPTILSMVRSPDNTNVTITWTSVSNYVYRVQYKSSLGGTSWLNLAPDVTATGSTASFTDHPGTASQRFYRVVLLLTETPLIPLVVVANDASRAYGGNNPVFSGTITGVESGDNITATYATTATASSPVGTYPITPSLVDPDGKLVKYLVTMTNGTLTVTAPPAPTILSMVGSPGNTNFTITWTSISNSVYRVQYKTSLASTSWLNLAPDVTATGSTASFTDHPGTASQRFYRVVLLLTETPLIPLVVVANDASRAYGGNNPVFSGTITGVESGDNITATYATTATASSPVGTYPITPSLVDPDGKLVKYLVTMTNGTLTVTAPPAPTILSMVGSPGNTNVTITWTSISNSVYRVQYKTSLASTSWLNLAPDVTATGSTASFTDHPGTASQRFYRVVLLLTETPLIPLVVVANDASRAYGGNNPVFSGTITGVESGDNITATYATTATASSPVGTYPITPSLVDPDGKLVKYLVTMTNGTLTVTASLAPTILSMVGSPGNTNVTITWTSVSNSLYRVQYKTNLASTNWLDLSPDVTATGSTASFTDHPGTESQRFYRTVVP